MWFLALVFFLAGQRNVVVVNNTPMRTVRLQYVTDVD